MLRISNFIVTYTQTKNCFCTIDGNVLLSNVNKNVCLQVNWDGGKILLWPNFSPFPEGTIGINAHYGMALNLLENTSVYVSAVELPPVKNKLSFKPLTEEDWIILEANSEKLQYSLLDQIRVVIPNQKLILWMSPSLSICVTSQNYGFLQKHCEIEIEPFSTEDLPKQMENSPSHLSAVSIKDSYISPFIINNLPKFKQCNAGNNCFSSKIVVLNIKHKNIHHQFTVFASKLFIQHHNIDMEKPFYNLVGLRKSMEISSVDNEDMSQVQEDIYDMVVELKELVEDIPQKFKKFENNSVFIPSILHQILQIESGKNVFFENIKIGSNLDILEIIPVKFKENSTHSEFSDIVEKFKSHIIECEKTENGFVINNGIIIHMASISNCPLQINLVPKHIKSVLVTSETIRNCKVIVNTVDNVSDNQKTYINKEIDMEDICRKIKAIETLLCECLLCIDHHLKIKQMEIYEDLPRRWHFIISGPPGSGKSTVSDIIADESGLWHMKISCRALKGKKDVHEVFSKSLKLCENYSPSILICDDIDSLLPAEVEGTSNQDVAYYDKLATLLKNMMLDSNCVFIIMTVQDSSSVHAKVIQSKGENVFTKRLNIPELDEADRCEILQYLIKQRIHGLINMKKLNMSGCLSETVGYKIKDLVEYIDRKIFNLMKNSDFNTNLGELLSAINKDKAVEKDANADVWSDIGGLKSVKQALVESICWPLMYPALFPPQCGGILLYGPPGTGKTLIGSCVARLSSMSFISVKGPELLSKYIGQSEMAVRNIFQKARKKSPCILFFDEFDSLAPSRGHDSTGVTDRVVNQLLTQMDGVEGAIRGVIIMAATSRPDLIDSALLRPGRFGNTLYCRMPNEEDRLEILQTLSRSVDFTDDVDLRGIARNTKGFSGADLKAILVTAQLMALEKQISDDVMTNTVVPLSSEFVSNALEETKPSLSGEKLMFYERIYSRFKGEARTSVQNVSQAVLSKPRATLA